MVIKKKILLFFETKSFFFFLSFFFLSAIKHTRSLSVERRSINTWKHTRLMSKLKRVNYKLQKFQKKKKKGIRSKMFVVAMCLRDILRQYFLDIDSLFLHFAKGPFSFQNIPYIFSQQKNSRSYATNLTSEFSLSTSSKFW